MLQTHQEQFPPALDISFDITVYKGLTKSKSRSIFKIHDEYELTVLYNSSGKRLVGNSIYNYSGGDMFLIGPNLPHLIIPDEYESSMAVRIHFTENSFGKDFFNMPQNSSILRMLHQSSLGYHFYGSNVDPLKKQMKQLKRMVPFKKMICFLEILYALSCTKDYSLMCSPGYHPSFKSKETKRMSLVYDFIMENFKRRISLDELASLINVSPATFCRLFKKTMNKNLSQFLGEVRIGHACKLLMDTDRSISEICYESGYHQLTHFNRQFKAITGKSPREFRQFLN